MSNLNTLVISGVVSKINSPASSKCQFCVLTHQDREMPTIIPIKFKVDNGDFIVASGKLSTHETVFNGSFGEANKQVTLVILADSIEKIISKKTDFEYEKLGNQDELVESTQQPNDKNLNINKQNFNSSELKISSKQEKESHELELENNEKLHEKNTVNSINPTSNKQEILTEISRDIEKNTIQNVENKISSVPVDKNDPVVGDSTDLIMDNDYEIPDLGSEKSLEDDVLEQSDFDLVSGWEGDKDSIDISDPNERDGDGSKTGVQYIAT